MADTQPPLAFNTDFEPQTGEAVTVADGVVRVTAPNSGPYTFTGTNTFILGAERVALVDPGPDDARHKAALEAAVGGRAVEAILLTHTHRDHSDLARWAVERFGAPLWFAGKHRLSRPLRRFEINPLAGACDWGLEPDRVLVDGERIAVAGMVVEAIATPGHCANHLAFGIAGAEVMLSGDHVMGWSSTLVAVPDGSMGDYLASLDRVIAEPYRRYLPAHGGPIADGVAHARALKAHREMRNSQILDEVEKGGRSTRSLLAAMYPGLSPLLLGAAAMTIRAHVEYLADRGEIVMRRTPFGLRIAPA